jgi:dTDP-4-dehydrorhamnose reductase
MRVLILGGSGMLGHKLWQNFSARFDTYATFRQSPRAYARFPMFDETKALGGVSAENFQSVVRAFGSVRPDVVVNCVGIVKQDAAAKDPYQSIAVNALFPHRLAQLTRAAGARLIHLSTDCVFSGRAGNYAEGDAPDAGDLYGRTKLLGEVDDENCLTVRTSMIGRELAGAHGLLEWFLSQEGGRVRGFRRAVFSGFTTQALSDVLARIVTEHTDLRGVWHVSAAPINKFDLLSLIKEVYGLKVEIEPDETFVCDRSLDSARFREATGFDAPAWPEMIARMHDDPTPYDQFRRVHANG